jgi:hypothetical protein
MRLYEYGSSQNYTLYLGSNSHILTDSFSGWGMVEVDISGDSLDDIPYIIFRDVLDFPITIDYIRVSKYMIDSVYYEIWDGATLLYQSIIEPDINDFIEVQPEGTYNQNDLFYFILIIIVFILSILGLKSPYISIMGFFISLIVLIYGIPESSDLTRMLIIIATIISASFSLIGALRRM